MQQSVGLLRVHNPSALQMFYELTFTIQNNTTDLLNSNIFFEILWELPKSLFGFQHSFLTLSDCFLFLSCGGRFILTKKMECHILSFTVSLDEARQNVHTSSLMEG